MKKSTRSTDIVTRMVTGREAVINKITNTTAINESPVLKRVSLMNTTYCSKFRYSMA